MIKEKRGKFLELSLIRDQGLKNKNYECYTTKHDMIIKPINIQFY